MADNTPTAFDEPTARRVLDATLAFERGVRPMSKHRHRLPAEGGGTDILWGQVIEQSTPTTSGWTDNRPGGVCTVDVHPCDNSDGDDVDTDTTHTVKAPIPDKKDPVYFEGDILPYIVDPDTDPVEYVGIDVWFDDEIGALKVWHVATVAGLPKGWHAATGGNGDTIGAAGSGNDSTRDLRGRFIVGWKSGGLTAGDEAAFLGDEGDYATLHDTDGSYIHAHDLSAGPTDIDEGTEFKQWFCITGNADGRPPYYVTIWIERVA